MDIHALTTDCRQQRKFPLGQIVITANALQTIPPNDVVRALTRHAAGDWGDLCDDDRRENEVSLQEGGGFHSVYRTPTGIEFWIITEADRSVTTILRPLDY